MLAGRLDFGSGCHVCILGALAAGLAERPTHGTVRSTMRRRKQYRSMTCYKIDTDQPIQQYIDISVESPVDRRLRGPRASIVAVSNAAGGIGDHGATGSGILSSRPRHGDTTSAQQEGNMTAYEDIIFEERPMGVARITINRPKSYNAFRGKTVEELIHAFQRAGWAKSIGVIVLTGAGDKAFCTGGDQGAHDGQYDGRGTIGLPIDEFQSVIRDMPKPVIARVNGFAIGGGNVLAAICDLTIASDRAQFGQVGPKVGSVDPGFGTAYLARVVGEKKAREMWYLCRRYTAAQAVEMGLVNAVVPLDRLDDEVASWCAELVARSPTALAIAKRSFNADTEHQRGISAMGMQALSIYYDTEESKEGGRAYREKRKPDFRKFNR